MYIEANGSKIVYVEEKLFGGYPRGQNEARLIGHQNRFNTLSSEYPSNHILQIYYLKDIRGGFENCIKSSCLPAFSIEISNAYLCVGGLAFVTCRSSDAFTFKVCVV